MGYHNIQMNDKITLEEFLNRIPNGWGYTIYNSGNPLQKDPFEIRFWDNQSYITYKFNGKNFEEVYEVNKETIDKIFSTKYDNNELKPLQSFLESFKRKKK